MRRFDTSKTHDELLQDVTLAWKADATALATSGKRAAADEIIASLEKKSDELINTLVLRNAERRDKAYNALAVTVATPAILAALGALLGWIAIGFRRRRT